MPNNDCILTPRQKCGKTSLKSLNLLNLPYGNLKQILSSLYAPSFYRLAKTNTLFADMVINKVVQPRVSLISSWHYYLPVEEDLPYISKYPVLVRYTDVPMSKTDFFDSGLPDFLHNSVTDRLHVFTDHKKQEKELVERLEYYNVRSIGLCTQLHSINVLKAISVIKCSYLRLTQGEEALINSKFIENLEQFSLDGIWIESAMSVNTIINILKNWKKGILDLPKTSCFTIVLLKSPVELENCLAGRLYPNKDLNFSHCFETVNNKGCRALVKLNTNTYDIKVGKAVRSVQVFFGLGTDEAIEENYQTCIYYTQLT